MNGVKGRIFLLAMVIFGIGWGFSAMVTQINRDMAAMRHRAEALILVHEAGPLGAGR